MLPHHETSIITGALDLTEKTAKDAMTPISETFSLDINCKLNMYAPLFISNWLLHLLYTSCCFQLQFIFIIRHTMGLIMSKGHGSIPIYSGYPTNIVGLILVRNSGTRVYYQLIGLSYFLARNSHTWLKAFHISYCLLHACAEY